MQKKSKKNQVKTKDGVYELKIWYDKKDKAYLVKVPSLPDVVTFGKSFTDAKKMAKDAIELYCDCVIKEGKIVIDDERKVFGKLPGSRIIPVFQ